MGKIVNWVKNNKVEFAILIAILAVGAFLRLYRIADYMTFLGDEGRDVIIVRRLLVYFDPILIGPGTSIGNMYLGPLYYYLFAPSLWLARFSPVGPSVFVALIGIATVFLVWKIGREWFPTSLKLRGASGLIAAALYAISPTVIIYSRSSWNPNIMPFFSLLCVYSIWKVWKDHLFKWLVVLSVSFAFVLQSHYLGLLLFPVFAIYYFLTWRSLKDKKAFFKNSIIGLSLFLFLMSPLVIFDARHSWRNFAAIKTFFTVRQETVSIRPWNAIPKLYPIFEKVNIRLLAGQNEPAGRVISVVLAVFIVWIILRWEKLNIANRKSFIILLTWLLVALVGLGLYKQEIYDHYYGFFFPAPFLLMGGLVEHLFRNMKYKILLYIFLLVLIIVNLINSPIRYPPNFQLRRSMEIAKFINEKSGGEKFNIATISERNNRDVYQYFLLLWGSRVVDTDPSAIRYTVTDQLFVVCEKPKEKCDPTHDPSAWITNFGWTKIVDQWEVSGINVYKLGHTK